VRSDMVATAADFTVGPHQHKGIQVGTLHVCVTCGVFGRTGVIWGRAPGRPLLAPDSEGLYRQERQS
jgi:hypothetical protein